VLQFSFNNVAPDDVIEFNVYDHNRLIKDAHMGEGSLSLRQVGGWLDTSSSQPSQAARKVLS
jgi:hypothetical protein